jgi:hypothetical protein
LCGCESATQGTLIKRCLHIGKRSHRHTPLLSALSNGLYYSWLSENYFTTVLYLFSLLFSPFPIYGGWINIIIIIIIIDNNWYPSMIQFGCSRFCDSINNGLYRIKKNDYIMICLCADLLSRPELICIKTTENMCYGHLDISEKYPCHYYYYLLNGFLLLNWRMARNAFNLKQLILYYSKKGK